MWNRIEPFYPPWLELIPMILLLFAFTYTFEYYPLLPEQVPTHFGLTGAPDTWAAKGFWSVFVLPLVGAMVWLSMLLINYFLIIRPDDPGRFINLPRQHKEKLGREQLEYIRTTTARGMMLLNLTLAAMIATFQYGSIKTALGHQEGLGMIALVFAAAILIESIGLSIKTISMTFISGRRGGQS
ncbi:hypothetical protein ASZ90_020013 [hydrocarbon metagenome]|uniref:DUF1648 domain-containing protein n=1 Tax=hydrocarbon metagenome TaxID=938273 RepID=A0A0W8E213_9ZZZZ